MSFSVQEFFEAFAEAPRPEAEEITSHRCCECDRILDDFAQYLVADVPQGVIEYHQDSLPLLSPKAFRYFLPRYVQVTCEDTNSDVTDMLLFNLSPDDPDSEFWSKRCTQFSEVEKSAIIEYLRHRRSFYDAEIDEKWIGPGLEYWANI